MYIYLNNYMYIPSDICKLMIKMTEIRFGDLHALSTAQAGPLGSTSQIGALSPRKHHLEVHPGGAHDAGREGGRKNKCGLDVLGHISGVLNSFKSFMCYSSLGNISGAF
jgi:hypothetical protein